MNTLRSAAVAGFLAVVAVVIAVGNKRRGPAEIIPFPARTEA